MIKVKNPSGCGCKSIHPDADANPSIRMRMRIYSSGCGCGCEYRARKPWWTRFEPCFVIRTTFSNRGSLIKSCVINRGFAHYVYFCDSSTHSRVIDHFLKKSSKKWWVNFFNPDFNHDRIEPVYFLFVILMRLET